MNTTHEYTDEQLQAAIDAAFTSKLPNQTRLLSTDPSVMGSYWDEDESNRLAIARAFLAALPKPAEADPYARLKAYNASGARIRCGGDWYVKANWTWLCRPENYEVHPDDLHMVPENAPKAETQQTELDVLRNTWGRVSAAVDAIDHKGDNTGIDDVLARLAVFKAPKGLQALPFFAMSCEVKAIQEMEKRQGMSLQNVLRRALRHYRQYVLRRHGIASEMPKPWSLPAPPAGFRWHREDWTADMLPEGYRPHLLNEADAPGDERFNSQGVWEELTGDVQGPTLEWHRHRRTRRPLPAEASAEPEQAKPAEKAGVTLKGVLEKLKADVKSWEEKADAMLDGERWHMKPRTEALVTELEEARAKIAALEGRPADDGPAWIPHDGGPCPLKDDEVEEWEWKLRGGNTSSVQPTVKMPPSQRFWPHLKTSSDITEYRIWKWKPGHGPQAASKVDEPATFEAHGKIWTRHTPGDPCPCDPEANIIMFWNSDFDENPNDSGLAKTWNWCNPRIVGWRYADEPAQTQAPAAPTPMEAKKPAQQCPHCGEPEIEAMTPRTVYACGSSDYDQRPGSLKLSEKCLAAKDSQPPTQPTQSPQDWTPRPGDVVRLKSGGPEMTVESVTDFGIAFCSWMTATSSLETRPVAVVMLQPAKEEARP